MVQIQTSVLSLQIPVALAASISTPSVSTALVAPILALRRPFVSSEIVSPAENLREAESVVSELSAPEQEKPVGRDEAYAVAVRAIAAANNDAKRIRAERLYQAKVTFKVAMALVIIGVLIIFAGVGLLLFRGAGTPGTLTTAIGAVTEIFSAVVFKMSNDANNRLDEIRKDLRAIEAAQVATVLTNKIEDPEKRREAIQEAIGDLQAKGIMVTA